MSCSRNRCPGSELKGSGYCKVSDSAAAKEQKVAFDAMLAARKAQDVSLMSAWSLPVAQSSMTNVIQPSAIAQTSATAHPVEPNPPSPRAVSGPGSTSTIITCDQGIKSPAASWQSR